MCEPGCKAKIESNISKYQMLINDANNANNTPLELLPIEEKEKQEIWFKAELLGVNEVSHSVIKCLSCVSDGAAENVDINVVTMK